MNIFQVLLILLLFFPLKWTAWKMTEEWGMPEWLQFKPWNCNLCLTFWTLLFTYVAVGILFSLWITLMGGVSLTIMNALAMWIDQRNKTVKIEDYDNDK